MSDVYSENEYLIRRKVFTLFGAQFHVFNPAGEVVMFSRQKAFKLREDIRIYTDVSESHERMLIKARQIIDFSAAYDVFDSESGTKVGCLRRKGWSSLVRDNWELLDPHDQSIGVIKEDSMMLALFRRLLTNLIPQAFSVTVGGQPIAHFRQNFNPFVFKLRVELLPESRSVVPPNSSSPPPSSSPPSREGRREPTLPRVAADVRTLGSLPSHPQDLQNL